MKYINVGLLCFVLIGVLAVITSAFRVDVAEGQDNVGIREKRETEDGYESADVETQARIVGFRQSEKEGKSAPCRGRKRRKGNGGNGGNGGDDEATTMATSPAEAERLRKRNG